MQSPTAPLGALNRQLPLATMRTRRVLVVEDESRIRGMLVELLEHAGYAVIEAGDGREALRRLAEHQPDLIILDLMLPGMSGWEFLNRSREQRDRTRVPLVIMSAIDGREDYPSTLGAAAWFTKPLDISRFLSVVEQLAGAPGSTDGAQATRGRVMLIEDDALIRDLLVEQLAEQQISVQAVDSIAAAHQHIMTDRPDLILLDLMLPGEDGWTFLHRRKADPALAAIPVLVISAAPQQRLAEAKALGANGFLSKPFDLTVLNALVHSFVRESSRV
jgi:DNA-binding response OmpR family regulator